MAASISEIKVIPSTSKKLAERINWLYPTLLMAAFFVFFRLGQAPVEQWDEAHTGINAIEMLNNGDWINLYFGGEPDRIRAKPPLVIWMVAANFSLYGYSAFSLRLHSAIATIFIFFFLYQIVRLYQPPLFAFAVCLIVLSVRGIIGFHVGRNGDFDAVLIAFLFSGLYFFLRYLDFMRYHDIYIAALCWGLAFWTKGPAFAILFPGLMLYIILDGRLRHVLRLREIYKAAGIMILFPLIWYLIVHFWGHQLEDPLVSGQNAFERMFLYDLRDRFTNTTFEGKTETTDPLFLWYVLRENFRYWDLVFYAVLLGTLLRKLLSGLPNWEPMRYRLLLLSVCCWVPLAILLSLATATKFWYFAPAIPFVAITTVSGLWWLYQKYPKVTVVAFSTFWLFCMYYRYLGPKPQATEGSKPVDVFTELIDRQQETLRTGSRIYQLGEWPAQRVLLDLYFANPNVTYGDVDDLLADNSPDLRVFIRRQDWQNWQQYLGNFTIADEDEHYLILEKN